MIGAEGLRPTGDGATDAAVVVLAGGSGMRFWPAGTASRPKQFLPLLGERSLLQESIDRARLLVPADRILVLTNTSLVDAAREQLPDLAPEQVIGEPVRRDTAAAVCLGALLVEALFGPRPMVVLTADHRIGPDEEFVRTMRSVIRAAGSSSALYTIGIRPDAPSIAYGYLEGGPVLPTDDEVEHRAVLSFHEKPERGRAEEFLESGSYFWNSGMFVWRTEAIIRRFEELLPQHVAALAPVVAAAALPLDAAALIAAFDALTPVSVDYGILEKATDVRMAAATFTWSDVGGWEALAEHLPSDAAANRHNCRLARLDAEDNMVYSTDEDDLVALVGVRGLVVVRAGNKTLVVPRERAETVKELVKNLEEEDQ